MHIKTASVFHISRGDVPTMVGLSIQRMEWTGHFGISGRSGHLQPAFWGASFRKPKKYPHFGAKLFVHLLDVYPGGSKGFICRRVFVVALC